MLELVRNSALLEALVSCKRGKGFAKLRSFANLGRGTNLQPISFAKVSRTIHYFCEDFCESVD